MVVNPRGLKKFAVRASGRGLSHERVSRCGGVTFNQHGRELPVGGMNEAGLVVEVLRLDETPCESRDGHPAVEDLQWMQLQLDTRESVADLLAHIAEVRIESSVARVHFVACDAGGARAAIEFIGNRAVVTAGDAMPVRALTDNSCAESLEYLRLHRGFGGEPAPASGPDSLDRLVRAACAVAGTASEGPVDDPVARALSVLDQVSPASGSVWNLGNEPDRLRIRCRTRATPRIKRIDLGDLDFACASAPRVRRDPESAGEPHHMPEVAGAHVLYPFSNVALGRGDAVRMSREDSRCRRSRALGRAHRRRGVRGDVAGRGAP